MMEINWYIEVDKNDIVLFCIGCKYIMIIIEMFEFVIISAMLKIRKTLLEVS